MDEHRRGGLGHGACRPGKDACSCRAIAPASLYNPPCEMTDAEARMVALNEYIRPV